MYIHICIYTYISGTPRRRRWFASGRRWQGKATTQRALVLRRTTDSPQLLSKTQLFLDPWSATWCNISPRLLHSTNCTCVHEHTHIHTHAHTQTHTHIHTHTHTHTHSLTQNHVTKAQIVTFHELHMRARPHAYTLRHTHHTHTHTHTYTHTHTHISTHAISCIKSPGLSHSTNCTHAYAHMHTHTHTHARTHTYIHTHNVL